MEFNLLNDELREQLTSLFQAELVSPVELMYFTSEIDCPTCDETRQLLEEVVQLSELLSLSTHDIDNHSLLADKYNIELAPALIIAGKEQEQLVDYGIRFLGIPSGYEFSSLIHSIGLVSRRDSGLSQNVREELKSISTPINLKIFVTPT